MYLTRIRINSGDIIKHRLFDSYRWKQVLCNSITPLPNNQGITRFFQYRLFDKGGTIEALVLSEQYPKPLAFGVWETKEIQSSFYQWSDYQFDILASPSVKKARINEDGTRRCQGRRVGRPVDEHTSWMEKKLSGIGCKVVSMVTNPQGIQHLIHKGRNIGIVSTRFSGHIKVIDKELFKEKVLEGIGPEKSFGYGMLLLKPLS